jgi:hypothetical protein
LILHPTLVKIKSIFCSLKSSYAFVGAMTFVPKVS